MQDTPDTVLNLGDVEREVVSWEVARDLTGGGLPGQVRGASGFSIASGRITFRDETDSTPWKGDRVKPGALCHLEATLDASPRTPLGRFRVHSFEASALSQERTLNVQDDLGAFSKPFGGLVPVPATIDSEPGIEPVEAAALIWAAGTFAGDVDNTPVHYGVSDASNGQALLSAPMQGTSADVMGVPVRVEDPGGWAAAPLVPEWGDTSRSGRLAAVGGPGGTRMVYDVLPGRLGFYSRRRTVLLAVVEDAPGGDRVEVTFNLRPPEGGGSSSRDWTFQLGQDSVGAFTADGTFTEKPHTGAAVAVDVDWSSDSEIRFRVWDHDAGEWGSWSAQAAGPNVVFLEGVDVALPEGAKVTALMVVRALDNDTSVTAAATAYHAFTPTMRIDPAGSVLEAPLPSDATWWEVIQEIAAATLGGAWLDAHGHLEYRNRDSLRGGGAAPVETLTVDSLADLPWSVSIEDVADRIEVTYNPVDVQGRWALGTDTTVWEASEAIKVPPGRWVTIYADIDGVATDLSPFYPVWDEDLSPSDELSRWAAATSPDGGGAQPADDALSIITSFVSPSRVRLDIWNRTSSTLWTVDGTGAPTLILRAGMYVRAGQQRVLSAGVGEEEARNPLSLDLGSYVQDEGTAREILDWLAGMVTQPLPVLDGVQVVPDLNRRLGDVVWVRDPEHTGLRGKALITGINTAGSAGSLTQTLRLAVLAPVFDDFDRFLVAEGIEDFDDFDAFIAAINPAMTVDEFDEWLSIVLGGA